jgi:hypothetical protein
MNTRKKRTVVKTPQTDRACRQWSFEMRTAVYRAHKAGVSEEDLALLTGRTIHAVRQQIGIVRRRDVRLFDSSFLEEFRITEGSPKGDQS